MRASILDYDWIMLKLIGSITTWLLLLAVPLQGQAATALLFCGAGHHGVLAQVEVQSSSVPHIESGAVTEAELGARSSGDAPDIAQTASAPTAQASEWTAVPAHGDDHCSAYSVMVGSSSLVQSPAKASQPIPYTREFILNCVPRRLDPPPKSFLV